MSELLLADVEALAIEHVRTVAQQIVRPSLGRSAESHRWTSAPPMRTAEDEQAGAALHELFSKSFPDHGLVIEDRETVAGDRSHCWFIDPIDGSANHLRGIPYVSISAGLVIDGVPVVGVVHDVLRDVTAGAHTGSGTRRLEAGEWSTMRVSETARLDDAMSVLHLARRGPLVCLPGALAHLMWNVRKIRCMGSIALDLLLLASGEVDLLVVGRGGPQRKLDILGGTVLLQEAGGALLTAAGNVADDDSHTLVAGPPELCRQFVELMAHYDLEGWSSADAKRPSG